MKRSKIVKSIPILGIYIILTIILYLVIQYKVKWEHKDLNLYLYFYNCNKELCTSITKPKDYYNKILCEEDICPYITNIINENVILEKNDKSWLYNYIEDKITNNQYSNYKYIGNDNFIVTNENNKQGIIDIYGNISESISYEHIEKYDKNILVYKENNQYKIKNNDIIYEINPEISEIIIINDKIFAAKQENKYNIYQYNNLENPYNNNDYDYIYAYKDIIITINNNKLDILTTNLNSTLLMKIDTFLQYTTEKERGSLNIITDNEYITFDVLINETEYKQYKYNTSTKKLI